MMTLSKGLGDDGWMDGWVSGWMGQRTCGWTDGEISDSSEALGEVASSIQGDQLSRFAQDIHGLTWVSLG